ncbi:MAG: hypothetical protein F9K19_01145 [Rhizobiaceae bacterium]|nr:MAG: hypothetical protein F9K19_01145 [Rhizobiaceae bacterium]CAG1003055.1 hypothetical protein RHIZO_02985 [Rhizobiaceae bacterium]
MSELPAHIWFVKSNGGSGSYPVRPEGWRVVWTFLGGLAVSAVLAMLLQGVFGGWALVLFAAGAAISAWYFISTARSHTDYSITYNDFVKDKKNV